MIPDGRNCLHFGLNYEKNPHCIPASAHALKKPPDRKEPINKHVARRD